jgi:hypothetical protein
MNYLTQHYKNLSEQLQEKVNQLKQLIETADSTPDNFDGPDADTKGSALEIAAEVAKTIEKMNDEKNDKQKAEWTASADAYQAERSKHLAAGTYES